MESHQELWQQCLQMISNRVDRRAYDVWFAPVVCESFDTQERTVLLQVPSRYVYEYLEQCQIALLHDVLDTVFRPVCGGDVKLSYRIRKEQQAPQAAFTCPAVPQIEKIAVPDARDRLEKGLRYYLKDRAVWLPCYDQVAEWLGDNKGRGLLCVGTSGLGKTLVCEKILPVILGHRIKTVTAREMGEQIDDLLKERCVIIDDLGHEPVEYKKYGNVRRPFFELCDAAERNGILLIVTTNLSTTPVREELRDKYPMSIQERYGTEVMSRLRAVISVVPFRGEDMRGV